MFWLTTCSILLQLWANFRAALVTVACSMEGETVARMVVSEFPPRQPDNSQVSLDVLQVFIKTLNKVFLHDCYL